VSRPHTPKPVLAIDIDDVLSPFASGLINWVNRRQGSTACLPREINYYGLGELLGLDADRLVAELEAYLESEEYQEVHPLDEALEVLPRLQEDYTLVVVTARHIKMRDVTMMWIANHFPEVFAEVIFLGDPGYRAKMDKAEVLRQLSGVALVDDNVEHVAAAARAGFKGILFGTYPWNGGRLPAGVSRARRWSEVEELLA
jgi:uncharacterized HAD superfamily protein